MVLTLIVDNKNSWIYPYVEQLKEELVEQGHIVKLVNDSRDISVSEITFILGCEKKIPVEHLKRSRHNLVVHESALPEGKGWSPVTWKVLEGAMEIPVTLFEATEDIDSGCIYFQDVIKLQGHELIEEIKLAQWQATYKLIYKFINHYPYIEGRDQVGEESFYPRRTPKDSELNIKQSIEEQFNLLRIVDNERYPAYFIKDGVKYIVKIYKEEV